MKKITNEDILKARQEIRLAERRLERLVRNLHTQCTERVDKHRKKYLEYLERRSEKDTPQRKTRRMAYYRRYARMGV